jgi:hypothetical protein
LALLAAAFTVALKRAPNAATTNYPQLAVAIKSVADKFVFL